MQRRAPDPRLAQLVASLRAQLDQLTDDVTTLIRDQIEIYRNDTIVTKAQLSESTRRNIERVLDQLARSDVADVATARQTGHERAAQGAPLPEVLRAYRLGFTLVWQRLIAAAREAGRRETDALIDASTDLWSLSDEYSTALTEAYRQEVTARTVALDRRRSALVAALVTGPAGDQHTAWEVSKLLHMPFEGAFLVVIAETPAIGDQALPRLEGHLHQLDVASAWRSQPDHEVGILSRGRRRVLDDVLGAIADAASTRVGVSPEFRRLDNTPRAARYAHIALETLPAGSAGMKQLPDTPLSELVTGNLDTTRRFVRRVLRGLLVLSEDDRITHLATAQAWLEARGSAVEAGRALYCHENTVRHRIRRLEERLGADLDDPVNLAELAVALEAIRTFPDLAAPITDGTTYD